MTRTWEYLKNGETLVLREASCVGCGVCIEVCPHNVFELADAKVVIRRPSSCMECGACAKNCPAGALSVKVGVGCAAAIIIGKLRGTAPTCDCGSDSASCATAKGKGKDSVGCC